MKRPQAAALALCVSCSWCAQGFVPVQGLRTHLRSSRALRLQPRHQWWMQGQRSTAHAAYDYHDLRGDGGVLKRVVTPGDGSGRTPRAGSKVRVHYDISVAGTGLFIDSSRSTPDSAAPAGALEGFEFYVNCEPTEAMLAWDTALQTMERGERCILLCAPKYAYGAAGAPPKIPPNATLECELELLDWTDTQIPEEYLSRAGETRDARMSRWEREIEQGVSPVQSDIKMPNISIHTQTDSTGISSSSSDTALREHRVVDLNSAEVRKQAAKQLVCGQGNGYTYMEKGAFITLFIAVPDTTQASDITCTITPSHISVSLHTPNDDQDSKTLLQGTLYGRVDIDGSYWCMSDRAVESFDTSKRADDVGFELKKGGTYVEVYLDKKPPHDTIWPDVFAA